MFEMGLMVVLGLLELTDLFSMDRPPPLGEGELLKAEEVLTCPRSSFVPEEKERI